jgi:hypothetical protein
MILPITSQICGLPVSSLSSSSSSSSMHSF